MRIRKIIFALTRTHVNETSFLRGSPLSGVQRQSLCRASAQSFYRLIHRQILQPRLPQDRHCPPARRG